jgi:KDO2-lipid IV(A) lauroyltransferase
LQSALGEDAPSAGACWADLGRRFVAFARGEADRVRVPAEAEACLRAALAEGRGVLVCTAHFGHWELLAAALATRGIDAHSLAARASSGPLFAWLAAHRRRLGVTTHGPGSGARVFRARCRSGLATGIFIDQNTGEDGRFVEFFGRPAPTPRTAERLCRLTGAVPLLVLAVPEGQGRWCLEVSPLPVDGLLEAATSRLEAAIRRAPTAWVWQHARW